MSVQKPEVNNFRCFIIEMAVLFRIQSLKIIVMTLILWLILQGLLRIDFVQPYVLPYEQWPMLVGGVAAAVFGVSAVLLGYMRRD